MFSSDHYLADFMEPEDVEIYLAYIPCWMNSNFDFGWCTYFYIFIYFVFSKFSGNSCVDEVMFLQLLMFRGIFIGKHRGAGAKVSAHKQ